MTKLLTLKRVSLFVVFTIFLTYFNLFATAQAASLMTPMDSDVTHSRVIAYIESDDRFVDLDDANAASIESRFTQNSIDNGYIFIFSTVNSNTVDTALKNIDKNYNLKDKVIKDAKDLDQGMLKDASRFLGSEQFSVVRLEIKEKSKETTDQKIGRYLGYAAGVAAIISIFKK